VVSSGPHRHDSPRRIDFVPQVLSELSLSGDDDYEETDNMLGQEERERLANMTELEREMEVALKEERLQQKRQRAQLLRKEKKLEKEAAAFADGKKTPSEKRSQDAKRAALEELASKKRRQTGKAASKRKVDDDEQEEGEEERSEGSEEGSEGSEEEIDYADEEMYGGEDEIEGDSESASYQEAKTIQVRRHKMEDWFDKPFFRSTMNGVVVRLAVGNKQVRVFTLAIERAKGIDIGVGDDDSVYRCRRIDSNKHTNIQTHKHTNIQTYKHTNIQTYKHTNIQTYKQVLPGELEGRGRVSYVCAKVLGLVEREPGYYKYNHTSQSWKSPYPFGKGKTSLWLRVIRGGSEKCWPLAQVSNSSITEQEWFHYQQGEADTRAKGGREMTRGDVERAKKRLLQAETYTYSEKDVAELLRSKKSVVKNLALEKARLERERDAAMQRGEASLAEELDVDIQKLQEESVKRRKEDKMAKVNAKNAKKNFHDGLAFREDGLDKGNDEMDPFRRRATRPMVYWKTKRDGDDGMEAGAVSEGQGLLVGGAGDVADVADVGDAIRQLLGVCGKPGMDGKGPNAVCLALYNPNSNIRRRMLSRKFSSTRDARDRVRVYHSLDEYLR